ncbi:isochorismatase family protein [Rosenbergiella collisarenosi]|uniref:isochorismatase family protein n=1 Tax=Rosenbergiella collisarenosi TaxID=1544695 RepID=UPI001BDA962A|nr:isochorismatase family protein [Rosenbergiella collisarenosi]
MNDALLVIDMQQFVQQRLDQGIEAYPQQAIVQGLALLEAYRRCQRPIIHIYHHDHDSGATLHQDKPAALPLTGYQPLPHEKFFIKHGSSAFTDTGLHQHLCAEGIDHLTVIGAVTGFCVNSTVRAAADLGLAVTLIDDATLSFALSEPTFGAELLWSSTLALLAADFAQVTSFSQWQAQHEDYL